MNYCEPLILGEEKLQSLRASEVLMFAEASISLEVHGIAGRVPVLRELWWLVYGK